MDLLGQAKWGKRGRQGEQQYERNTSFPGSEQAGSQWAQRGVPISSGRGRV